MGVYICDYTEILSEVENCMRKLGQNVIVVGDFNAHSTLWGDRKNDRKGRLLEDFAGKNDLHIINESGTPTFKGPGGESSIDISMVSLNMIPHIGKWGVEEWTCSDHRVIFFEISPFKEYAAASRKKFSLKGVDWEKVQENIQWHIAAVDVEPESIDETVACLSTKILRASKEIIPMTRGKARGGQPWWNKELTRMKKEAYHARRRYQRHTDPLIRAEMRGRYLELINLFHKAIEDEKRKTWKEYLGKCSNPWGFPYRKALNKLQEKNRYSSFDNDQVNTRNAEESISAILACGFPDDDPNRDSELHKNRRKHAREDPETEDAEPWDEEDVEYALEKIKTNKAPGPDSINGDILKHAKHALTRVLMLLFNRCLDQGYFPEAWKEGEVVAIPKPGRDESTPSSFRPICLLNVQGKVLERLILYSLGEVMAKLSTNQFGGSKGRSPTDAISLLLRNAEGSKYKYVVALFFDIQGAFDNLWWPGLFQELKVLGYPKNLYRLLTSFLENRTVYVQLPNRKVKRNVERGCAQGSVLGLPLWRIFMNRLLIELHKECVLPVAYVDDLSVSIEATSRADLERKASAAIGVLLQWCEENKMRLNCDKTKLLFLKGKMKGYLPQIRVGEAAIRPSEAVKFLGVTIAEGMKFVKHIEDVKSRTTLRYTCLRSIAANDWGLNNRNRLILYKALYLPMALYAAPAWGLNLTSHERSLLQQSQRRALLLITRSYKTAPTTALQIIAGQLPIDLKLQVVIAKFNLQRNLPAAVGEGAFVCPGGYDSIVESAVKEAALAAWQKRWEEDGSGRTTFEFLPNVRERLEREWFEPDFWTTQLLTGHGNINQKLHQLGLRESPLCRCGEVEGVRHIIFDCPFSFAARRTLAGEYGLLDWPPDSLSDLVNTEDRFRTFKKFARQVLEGK